MQYNLSVFKQGFGLSLKKIESLLQDMQHTINLIKEILELQNMPLIEKKILQLASTTERKNMWMLSDGKNSSSDIAKKVGVSARSVRYFVEEGKKKGLLVIEKRGYPKRKFEYIP